MAAHQATFEQGDSELWYVATGPGETKLLTLEQLDDLFRLEIIDANTRLWQPGMREWLPLSVVAGLDEPSQPTTVQPPSGRVARAPAPPPPFVRSVAAAAPIRPAPIRTVPAPAPLPMRTAPLPAPAALPMSTSSLPPGRPVPVAANTWPSAAPAATPFGSTWPVAAPASAAPARNTFSPPESIRPLAISTPAPFQPRGAGGFGRFVLTLAVVAGVAVTLYRNDVVRRAALSAGLEKSYLKLESALGGPGFGTPRAVSSLLTPSSTTSTTFASTSSARSSGSNSDTSNSLAMATSLPSTPAPSSTTNAAGTTATTAPDTASAPAREEAKPAKAPAQEPASEQKPRTSTLASSLAASVGGGRTKPAAARPSAPTTRKAAAPVSEAPAKSLGFNGGKSKYDPLNGNF